MSLVHQSCCCGPALTALSVLQQMGDSVKDFLPQSMQPSYVLACQEGMRACVHCLACLCVLLSRGQMWSSGYVVVPTSTGCCISVTLQVDPKVRGRHCGQHLTPQGNTMHVHCRRHIQQHTAALHECAAASHRAVCRRAGCA
jgi:hypothetical protein